jgi:GT2 family glycosyltransferase
LRGSVASITTAFNAIRLLPRQIDALLRQSRPLQEIVIVDNGSTDGTSAMLAERYPKITVLRLRENVGAAGGWAAGLTYAALERGHDWVWNFDDDSVPSDNALEILLAGALEAGAETEVGMVVPLPVHATTGIPYPPLFWRDGFVKPEKESLEQPIWFADLAIASGCMVRREVVTKIGLPRSDFFMDFFDFEYCLRMRSSGFAIAVITACKFSHEIGGARNVRLPGFNRLWPDYAPWREYYLSRNMVYAAERLYPTRNVKLFVAMHLLRHATGVILFGKTRFASLQKMLQGARDGRRGRMGIRFLPR